MYIRANINKIMMDKKIDGMMIRSRPLDSVFVKSGITPRGGRPNGSFRNSDNGRSSIVDRICERRLESGDEKTRTGIEPTAFFTMNPACYKERVRPDRHPFS